MDKNQFKLQSNLIIMTEQDQPQQISIEQLELSLEVYQIQSQDKLKKLQQLFQDKKTVDLGKMFYQEKSSLEIKFQNIVSDLTQFLINQQIASTDKLRKTFYRLLENPLIFLFKVSRFEIFNLRLNAFDIELEPIEAIAELASSILNNIDIHRTVAEKLTTKYAGGQYRSFQEFLQDSKSKLIQDQIFLLYSYLRKGGNIIKKKFQDKVRVIQIYNKIEQKLLKRTVQTVDLKTLKQISILNYELYLLDNTYDVLCFYLKVPLRSQFQQAFKQLQTLANKAKQTSNYDVFILIFLRYSKEIINKVQQQGIDPVFAPYIQNVLCSILELWACRLCHFQQFYQLFKKLLNLHPKKASVLSLCLKHNPDLKKDDIVLLRTHFKHDLLQKHSELLSLLKKKTIEQINVELSALYHQTLYNLDFDTFSRQQIIQLLTLLNGNSSLNEFFSITERAFKQWNHTVNFNLSHKYIDTQFKYPALEISKILESVRLFNNLCILQTKNFKDYQTLVKGGSVQNALVGLSSFLFTNQKALQLVSENELLKVFLLNALQFLKRTGANNADWQLIAQVFSLNLAILGQKYSQAVIQQIRDIISSYPESFTVKNTLNIFQKIIQLQQQLKISSETTVTSVVNIFLKGTSKQNEQIKKFRFFGQSIDQIKSVTQQQAAFLQKYATINQKTIEAQDNGCFVLSELQIITNPVQFDKVMDNYYFTLDNNSKRFIQFIASNCTSNNASEIDSTTTLILKKLTADYPISLPLLSSTRVPYKTVSKKFVEILVDLIDQKSLDLLKSIIQCRFIKYRNGRDYIQQQIVPIILKQAIKLLNEGSKNIHHFELAAYALVNLRPADVKIDILQKAIEAFNYEISEANSEETVFRLSRANYSILKKYFQKKQIDMRKKGLQTLLGDLIWSDTRTKLASLQSEDNKKVLKKTPITQQIMLTPYIVSPEYNSENSKLEKVTAPNNIKKQEKTVELSSLKSSLRVKPAVLTNNFDRKSQNLKTIDLTGLKYSLQTHLGEEVITTCFKQGFKLLTSSNQEIVLPQSNEQNITLVQYYLKQYQSPQISSQIILKYVSSLINEKLAFSYLFTNHSNLQKLFAALIILLQFLTKENSVVPQKRETLVDQILIDSLSNKQKTQKIIIKVFSEIGYTNLWSENYNSLKNLVYFKQLRDKTSFKEQAQQQTFFSWLLTVSLQNDNLKQELNTLLAKIFESRPKDQNSLMYKVTINRALLNLIMKSLQITNLSYISLLFHSNFNNLRLYTDQLHQGLKSLNIASKNRAFNQYIQLSKDIQDEQFFLPMKLFKQNFSFFIRIQKQGYRFKKGQQQKLGRERVLKVLRGDATGEALIKQVEQVVVQFEEQLQKLQQNIANRVKSFYLVTKLRDLSFQNSQTICLLHQILLEKQWNAPQILNKIKQVEIFSLISQLNNDLVRFGALSYQNFLIQDRTAAQKDVNICTIRRYSHSMSKIYEKCELQFDQVFQRCIDGLKLFFNSNEGKEWLKQLNIYPPYLSKSFIDYTYSDALVNDIRTSISKATSSSPQTTLITEDNNLSTLVKSLRELKKSDLLSKNKTKISYKGNLLTLTDFLPYFKDLLIRSETLSKSKDGFLLFNKYKTSEKTLEEIEILGYIVGYAVFNNIQIDLPLHSSLLAAISFGVCDLDDLLDVDFKVWEDLRNVISTTESKDLNLNFSYIFESLQTLKPQRVQLIDKGSSKKVNNLNRQEYADLICCYLLYKVVSKQLNRFLQSLLYVCPKQLLSSLRISEIHNLFIKKYPDYSKEILKKHMKKRGLVLPSSILIKGKRVQNLKDYQNIQWLCQILEENNQLKQQLWKNESNLFVCTYMEQGLEVDLSSKVVLIGRFSSKAEVKQALTRILAK